MERNGNRASSAANLKRRATTLKNRVPSFSERLHKRPGIKKLHTFRSQIVSITTFRDRMLVILESGKAYRSNLKMTRWYKISPEPFFGPVATLSKRRV